MSNLIISIFRDEPQAEKARRELLEKDRNGALGLEDVVTVEKTRTGRVRFHHVTKFTVGGAVGGAFLGMMMGVLMLNPIIAVGGLFVGFAVGLVYGLASPVGINPDAVRNQAQSLDPGQAALCVQPGNDPAQVAAEIGRGNGNTLRTDICTLSDGAVECRPWR
jgi:uncharacterized membrane protein